MKYGINDMIRCPHCGEEQQDKAHCYVVGDIIGSRGGANEECWECSEEFYVERIDAETIEVS